MAVSKNNPKQRSFNRNEPQARSPDVLPRYFAGGFYVPRNQRKAGAVKAGTARSRSR